MTIAMHDPNGVEDPTEQMTKMEALEEAVAAAIQAFDLQFGVKLEPEGKPGSPNPRDAEFGSTIALTNEQIKYQYSFVFERATAQSLTRTLFAMEADEEPSLAEMSDALGEIPNVAAGLWKSMRNKSAGENYQLGLPIFLMGNTWVSFFPRSANTLAQKLCNPDGLALQVLLIWS